MLLDLRFLWESSGSTAISGALTAQAIAQVNATGTIPVAPVVVLPAAHPAARFRKYASGGAGNDDVLLALWASGDLTDDEVLQILGVNDPAIRKLLRGG